MSFYEGKKVLVTGASGFCGRHVVEALWEHGVIVRSAPHHLYNLTSESACMGAVSGMDYVFHFAGAVGNAGMGSVDMMGAIAKNLAMTSNILHACWKQGVERLLLCGSSTVYPEGNHPMSEEEALNGPVHPSYFGYGEMYRYIEKLADFVAKESDLKIARVRPTAVYGRHDHSEHVIPSLIRRALAKEDPFVVWGTGEETRDFLHVTDLARGCLMALERNIDNHPINIGYGSSMTIEMIASIILTAAEHYPKVVYDSDGPTAIPFRAVDTSFAYLMGFEPQVSFARGIKETVEWFKENQCVSV